MSRDGAHPDSERLLERLGAAVWNNSRGRTVDAARRSAAAHGAALSGPPAPMAAVWDITLPGPAGGVTARVYRPIDGAVAGILVWLHGGGFVLGSVDQTDVMTRALAAASGCVLVSVEYRLAPEHPFPAGLLDAYAAVTWAATHGDDLGAPGGRLAVGGESAGGNLAAAVTLLARRRETPPIEFQVLVYPMTWCRTDAAPIAGDADDAYPSIDAIEWFSRLYLSGHDPTDPLASPQLAESLEGLPPALVVTAEHDSLRGDGERYAIRLIEAGVPVEIIRYEGMLHGFLEFGGAAGVTGTVRAALDRVGRGVSLAVDPTPGPERRGLDVYLRASVSRAAVPSGTTEEHSLPPTDGAAPST